MQLLYINADFDENGLETKVYDSIESFVQDRIGIAYSLLELEAFASEEDEDEEYLDEVFVLNLLKSGSHEGEWSTEEVWLIEDGKFSQGIQELDMDTKEIQALSDLIKALLSINGSSRRLGINTE